MSCVDFNGSRMVNRSASNGTGRGNMPVLPKEFQSVAEIMSIVSICCYVCIFVLSTLGNTAIIGIVLNTKNMRTKANVLIVNMAISDLIVTILTIPRALDVEVTGNYQWKIPDIIAEVLCKLNPFIREVSCAVSIFSMVGIALDRFFAIAVPMAKKPSILDLKFLIPIIWLTSMATNALYLYAYQLKVVLHECKTFLACYNTLNNYQEKFFDTFRFAIFIAMPLLLLSVMYISIAVKMTSQNIPGANVETFAKNRRKQNRKIVTLAVVIVVSFAVCWVPYYIGLLLHAFLWESQPPPFQLIIPVLILNKTFTLMTYVSLAVNPFVCLAFSSNFRRNARKSLCGLKISSRAVTRITTTTNPCALRALSVTNLDISLENGNSNTNPGSQDLMRDVSLVTISNQHTSQTSLNNRLSTNKECATNPVGDCASPNPFPESLDDTYFGNSKRSTPTETPEISASFIEGYPKRSQDGEPYLNQGFVNELHEI